MIQYAAFSKENGLMGWLKGPHFGGKVPATFLMADGIEIFIDESGDFGSFDERCPYYIVALHSCHGVSRIGASIVRLYSGA